MPEPQTGPGQSLADISVGSALRAIWGAARPRLIAFPRFLKRNLIYTRVGRYILVPLLVLAVGRILVSLIPIVLPGCNTAIGAGVEHGLSGRANITAACESSKETEHELTLDILLFVLGLLASTALERYGLRALYAHARKVAHEAQRHPFLARLGATRFEQDFNLLSGLAHGSYAVASPDAMHEWFADFFTESPGRYRGVDTHLPSEYLRKYKWYLDEHEASLKARAINKDKRLRNLPRDVRVLAVDPNELGLDIGDNEKSYREFVKWHKDNHVDVYWMPRNEVAKLCNRFHIGTSDVGLWDDYGVFFKNLSDGRLELSLRFQGAPSRDKLSYKEVTDFMDQIISDAEPLTANPPDLEIFGGDLAARWEGYVDPVKRNAVVGPFLESILADQPLILDAAAGIGCESIALIQQSGHSVYSNELDGRFAAVALERAQAAGVKLKLTKQRWEALPGALEGNMRFNGVLVLGNSLCMVHGDQRRGRCLKAFFECLRPGGLLVIDERNFQYLLDHRNDVISDPYGALGFVRDGDVMYHGTRLRSFPTAIADDSVTWSFADNEQPAQSSAELLTHRIPDSDLQLYPFKHGELYGLLHSTGFVEIDVYADLHRVGNGDQENAAMPSAEAIGESSFITYVAKRPK